MPPSSPSHPALANSDTMSAQAQRRERKRKHDREAQRLSRERTKIRVKELEELVDTLQAANQCPERISNLLLQIQSVREQNARLRERVRKAAEILAMDAPSEGDEIAQQQQQEQHESNSHSFPLSDHGPMLPPEIHDLDFTNATMQFDEEIPIFEASKESSMLDASFLNTSTELQSYHYPVGDFELHDLLHDVPSVASNPDFEPAKRDESSRSIYGDPVVSLANAILNAPTLEGRFWFLAGTVLKYILNMSEQILTPRALDDDIAIRASVEGWDTVNQMYWLDAGWRWLRHLDENMYGHLNSTNRMAMLRVMRMQYLHQRQPRRFGSHDLPDFMVARPAQEQLAHEKVIEHFVWPGMREHMLFARDRYATNRFMEPFRKHLRFAWPHEPSDAYELEIKSDLHRFTPLYLDHQSRIECWQMDPDFFNLFPEFRAAIPASSLSPSKALSTGIVFGSADAETIDTQEEEDMDTILFHQQRSIPSIGRPTRSPLGQCESHCASRLEV